MQEVDDWLMCCEAKTTSAQSGVRKKTNNKITLAWTLELKHFIWDPLLPSFIWKHNLDPLIPGVQFWRIARVVCFVVKHLWASQPGGQDPPGRLRCPQGETISKKNHLMVLKLLLQSDCLFYPLFPLFTQQSLPNTHKSYLCFLQRGKLDPITFSLLIKLL